MSYECKPITSRKFIRVDGTEFDVLLGDGSVFDLRDLETWYGEHWIAGTECTTANLINFLRAWGVYNSSGSSLYIKSTNTVIPNSDTLIGDIPLGDSLIIKYNTSDKTILWLYANNRTIYRYLNNVWSIENLNTSNFVSTSDINVTVAGLQNGLLDSSVIPELPKEIVYGINMTALQALQTKASDIIYIDLSERIQYYWNGSSFIPYNSNEIYATQEEAEEGILTDVVISPKTAKDAIEYHKSISNVLESSTLNAISTNNTGINTKLARKDHTHKVEGFALTNHVHTNGLVVDSGTIVTMDNHTVVPIDASTLNGSTNNDFATSLQGGLADTAVQTVTLGGVSVKNGTTVTLPRYPLNGDFKLSLLSDFPSGITNKKILVTNSSGGFDFKDYFSETEHDYTSLLNKPVISLDGLAPSDLSTPQTLTGTLKLHPIVTSGLLTSLNDVSINSAVDNDVLQYKNGEWVNSVIELTPIIKKITFDNNGSGSNPGITYDGTVDRVISYNSIGASPLSHNHTLSGLIDVTFADLEEKDTLYYNGNKWVNRRPYQPSNLTFNNSGNGAVPGTVYNGGTNLSISYNTIGAAASNHTHNLNDLNNVTISNPSTNQVLAYDGTHWINTTSATGTTYALNDLTDTIITSPITSQVLRYDGTNWVNVLLSYEDLSNKPILNTSNATTQTANATESFTGTINLHKVSKTGTYSDLLGKPTIPSAPGTLNTTLTTTQTTNASEALTGNINLHKVAKTGTFSDLIGLSLNAPVNGEVLKYNGTNWVNGPDNTGGGSTTMYTYDVAFVDAGGNDSTAVIGDINHPFLTLAAAITAAPIIQVMSDLTINTPIFIESRSTVINLYNNITITYQNDTTPYVAAHDLVDDVPNSLFIIRGTDITLKINSDGVSKFICNDGVYSSNFATIGSNLIPHNSTLSLQNINIEHVGTVLQPDILFNSAPHYGVISTIISNNKSLLKTKNCHILTYNTLNTSDVACFNIRCTNDHVLELNDSKLTLLNAALSGISMHIYDIDIKSKVSLLNCQTAQILRHATLSTLTNWTIRVMGTEYNATQYTAYTISNCKFYIGSTITTRDSSSWNRIDVTPSTAIAISISGNDVIEYLGTSLHNYGKTHTSNEPTGSPIQYGGVYSTSLVKCPLLQPYEIDYTF